MTYDPTKDGIDHINIYSRGRTELGRLLSNWAISTVRLPEGRFLTIEGYWFYLLDPAHSPHWMGCNGWRAKTDGKELGEVVETPEFEAKIKAALWSKTQQDARVSQLLAGSTLPFAHYYVYGDKPVPAGYEWLTAEWEAIRSRVKSNPT